MKEAVAPSDNVEIASFNAGLMVINPDCKSQAVWNALLQHLSVDIWRNVASDHTDQAVYNRQFGNLVTLANPAYNYLIGHAAQVRSAFDTPMSGAKVLHYNGPAKPWRFEHHLDAIAQDAGYIKALQHWQRAYAEFLAKYHFAAGG
jgi:lipopolysaccharide biosynthesis glycosyltransferase